MNSITRRDLTVNGSPVPARSSLAYGLIEVANRQLHQLRVQRAQQPNNLTRQPGKSGWLDSLAHHVGERADRVECSPSTIQKAPTATKATSSRPRNITVHPSLLTAMLKAEQVAIGRIWLLCRHLDTQGRGWVSIATLRSELTGKQATLRICGWRRLRQILQQGAGLFWQRDAQDRLWLKSLLQVATALRVKRFVGDAIAFPINDLRGNIGDVRAAFYHSFHCGREAAPIARTTLVRVTGVAERTQRNYDRAQQIQRVANYTLTAAQDTTEASWQHGRAAFKFIDKKGNHGAPGQTYTAIRLPNSYETSHYARLSKKQSRFNKQLAKVLANNGVRGNGAESLKRLFFTDAKGAGQCFGRNQDCYLHNVRVHNQSFWLSVGN